MEIVFKNINYKNVINNIDLTINSGEITCIIGKSGSGKSTLLELIGKQKAPTSGKILIDESLKIGYVEQFVDEQFFCKTVESEIEKTLKLSNCESSKIKSKILNSIKMVNLNSNVLSKDPLTISGCDMKKLSLAKALCINPSILLLDEPTSNMNSEDKKNIIKLLNVLKRKYNKTIVIATNDIEFVHLIADKVVALKSGNIILEGDKYEVFKNVELLKKNNISVPKIIEFSYIVQKDKKIKLGYRDEINDLIKDILRKKEV